MVGRYCNGICDDRVVVGAVNPASWRESASMNTGPPNTLVISCIWLLTINTVLELRLITVTFEECARLCGGGESPS